MGLVAGGVICDLDSLKVWPAALATGKLLSPEMQKERLAEWRTMSKGSHCSSTAWESPTGTGSSGTTVRSRDTPARPSTESDGTTIVVLTNLTSAPDNQGPAEVLTDAIAKALPPAS